MNLGYIERHFGLLPFNSKYCIRRKIIGYMFLSVALMAAFVFSAELLEAKSQSQDLTKYNAALINGYRDAVIQKIEAEADIENLIADANQSCNIALSLPIKTKESVTLAQVNIQ